MSTACPCRDDRGFRAAIRADIDRAVLHVEGNRSRMRRLSVARAFFLYPGLTGVLLYRLSHLQWSRGRGALGAVLARFSAHLVGVECDPSMHVGPGLFINHFGNVFLGAESIGANCNIAHGVTIGRSMGESRRARDVPVLGDRVWVGPNTVIAGGITIGDDAVLSACSLVPIDVPAAGIAAGVPARVRGRRGSFQQVLYRGMEDDPDRQRAMAALAAASSPPPQPVAPGTPAPGPNGSSGEPAAGPSDHGITARP